MAFQLKLRAAVLGSLITLAACSGSDGTDVNVVGAGDQPWNLSEDKREGGGSLGGGGSGDGGGSGGGVLTQNLDCTTLDPDKVYSLGTMRYVDESGGFDFGVRAMVDPASPATFCAAFGQDDVFEDDDVAVVISSSGNAIYGEQQDGDIYAMRPDTVSVDSAGNFAALGLNTMLQNDVLLAGNPDDALPERIVAHPSEENLVFFQGESSVDPIISSESGDVYYTPDPGRYLMGVLEDGSLLLFNIFDGVIRLSPALEETVLVPPVAGPYENIESRSKIASDGTVWITVALEDDTENLMRWRIDPSDNSVVNEGGFADLPENVTPFTSAIHLLDGEGNLWQNSNLLIDSDNFFGAVRRPIASSAEASVSFHQTEIPAGVSVISYMLVTGP